MPAKVLGFVGTLDVQTLGKHSVLRTIRVDSLSTQPNLLAELPNAGVICHYPIAHAKISSRRLNGDDRCPNTDFRSLSYFLVVYFSV